MPKRRNDEEEQDTGHRFAYDSNGKWVDAKNTLYKKHAVFTCDCPDRHQMRLSKPSGLPGKRPFCDYFAHISPNKKHKPSGQLELEGSDKGIKISCRSGGESKTHKDAKHTLRELVGSYYFTVSRCRCCNKEVIQDTVGCTVSMEHVSDDKKWRFDCLLKKDNKAVTAMEVVHTHLSGSLKINSVRTSGLELVEFRAEDVMAMAMQNGKIKLENIKIRTEICHDCLIFDLYKKDMKEWKFLEYMIFNELLLQDAIRKGQEQEERQKLKKEDEERKNREKAEIQKRVAEEANKQKQKKENEFTSEIITVTDQTMELPKVTGLIYKCIYHTPDGSACWTPYEMIAHKIK